MFHHYYDKTHCLYQVVNRNKPPLAILGELHVLKLLCFINFGLLLSAETKMTDLKQSHCKVNQNCWAAMRCKVTFSPNSEVFLNFSNVSEASFETLIMRIFFHFHNTTTNIELKNKMHWCKDSETYNDLVLVV